MEHPWSPRRHRLERGDSFPVLARKFAGLEGVGVEPEADPWWFAPYLPVGERWGAVSQLHGGVHD